MLELPSLLLLRDIFYYDQKSGVVTRKISVNWKAKKGDVVGSINNHGYLNVSVFGTSYLLHRVIWKMLKGCDPEDQIDHINGNRIDNREINLRSVDSSGNHKNMGQRRSNKSGVTGVFWDNRNKKWRVQISHKGKSLGLGRFKSMDDAVKVRRMAEEMYGYHKNHGRR